MNWLEWDHNAYYRGLLARQLPARCHRVLDVGCGAGGFAADLARRAEQVDALDRSPVMIEAARRAVPSNVRCILADVLDEPLPAESYDAIVSVTALHHMPLEAALPRLAAALRPGGVLAAVALPRTDLLAELPVELAATCGHRLLGASFALLRAVGHGSWYRLDPGRHTMPMSAGEMTTRQVRRQVAAVLPGAQVRRLMFWRYLLLWHKPAS